MSGVINGKSKAKTDYDLAYAIMEEMGLGFKIRNCSCGQLPCARLKPIVNALRDRDERAAKIAESHLWGTMTDSEIPEQIAKTIARRCKQIALAIRSRT